MMAGVVDHVDVKVMARGGEAKFQRGLISGAGEMDHRCGGDVVLVVVPQKRTRDITGGGMIAVILEAEPDFADDGRGHVMVERLFDCGQGTGRGGLDRSHGAGRGVPLRIGEGEDRIGGEERRVGWF